jgi:hypothetical protein
VIGIVNLILPINDLSARHYGLTKPVADSLAEAATVCLHRHHLSPQVFRITRSVKTVMARVDWITPSHRMLAAHANDIDATELGACAVVLAGVELTANLVAVARAETRTGADYYLLPVGSPVADLEDCIRVEVSGMNKGGDVEVQRRLDAKRKQAASGDSPLPAIAAVVSFEGKHLAITDVEAPQ